MSIYLIHQGNVCTKSGIWQLFTFRLICLGLWFLLFYEELSVWHYCYLTFYALVDNWKSKKNQTKYVTSQVKILFIQSLNHLRLVLADLHIIFTVWFDVLLLNHYEFDLRHTFLHIEFVYVNDGIFYFTGQISCSEKFEQKYPKLESISVTALPIALNIFMRIKDCLFHICRLI